MNKTKKEKENKNIFTIPEANWISFKSRFEKLQKKADKLGVGGSIAYRVIQEKTIWVDMGDSILSTGKKMKAFEIEVFGSAPKYEGWTFIGRLEHDQVIGTIVRTAPGYTVPSTYYEAEHTNCDHCKTNRFRKDTFVLGHENGEYKQVGRQCIKDFLGHEKPERIAQYFSFLFQVEDMAEEYEGMSGSGGERYEYFDLISWLATTSAVIRAYGWLSRTKAKESDYALSTSDIVSAITERPKGTKKRYPEVEVTEADKQEARDTIEWVVEKFKDKEGYMMSEYELNIYKIAKAGLVDYWKGGFASSIILYVRKEKGLLEERERESKTSEYYGEVGTRVSVEQLILTFKTSFDTQYGTTHLYKFKKEQYTFVWFSSNCMGGYINNEFVEYAIGDVFNITGRIKKHEEYRDIKQTVLTRCKLEVKAYHEKENQ
jgi:hypothetical protein